MLILDKFTDGSQWNKDAGISISDGKLMCTTGTGHQWAWQELPEPLDTSKPFRLTALVNIQKDIAFYIGFANSSNPNPSTSENKNILWVGYSANNQTPQWRYGNDLDNFTTNIDAGVYRLSLTSDGRTITYSVENSDDENIAFMYRFDAVLPTYTHLVVKFIGSSEDTWIEQISFKDALGNFGDAEHECKTKFVIMPDETGLSSNSVGKKDKRDLVVLPKLEGKHRLLIYSHGYMGSWSAPNKEELGHFFDKMCDKGYACISMDCNNHDGHWIVTTQAFLARKHLINLGFKFHYKIFTMGLSMGALYACNMAIDYPDLVSRICLIGGHSNLLWRYYGIHGVQRSTSVHTSYDCDESTVFFKTRGRNPYENFEKLAKYPLLALHNNETHVEPIFSEKIVEGINNAGGDATYELITESTEHSSIHLYDSEKIANFFDLSSDAELERPPHIKTDISGGVRIS